MIRYKVVTKERKSSGSINRNMGKYCLTYHKGTIVRSIFGSVGIAVFDSYKNARRFISLFRDEHRNKLMIVVVVAELKDSKDKIPCVLEYDSLLERRGLEEIYKDKNMWKTVMFWNTPSGTEFYRKVLVLN